MRTGPLFRIVLSAVVVALALIVLARTVNAQETPAAPDAPAAQPALVPLYGVTDLAVGYNHACALIAGRPWCWGSNSFGQLGTGDTASSNDAIMADYVGFGAAQVAAGGDHTCVVTVIGTVRCWGWNRYGQLGDGTTTDRLRPVGVTGLDSVKTVAAGPAHTCALRTTGDIWCWGAGEFGELGNGLMSDSPTPVRVSGQRSYVDIAVGGAHVCAVDFDSQLYCWGSNNYGQLGDSTRTNRSSPTLVFVYAVHSLAAGHKHTCIVQESGPTWCWGDNFDGQLGDGTTAGRPYGAYVAGLTAPGSAVQVLAGWGSTCAIGSDQEMLCWGDNQYGQAGTGVAGGYLTVPTRVGRSMSVLDADGGLDHTCARTAEGNAYCWGLNNVGQVGDGTQENRTLPKAVRTLSTCYAIRFSSTGSLPPPTPNFAQSDGCPLGHYLAGAQLELRAAPGPGTRVAAWSYPAQGGAGSLTAQLTVPPADITIAVAYEACHALTTTVAGQGQAPVVSPTASTGCVGGGFAANESLALTAAPAPGWRVAGWTGTTNDASPSATNTATMPAGPATVGVRYERGTPIATDHRLLLPFVVR